MNTFPLPKTQHSVVFQKVIRSGSIGAEAKALGPTRPAVSKVISNMESYFGSELIVRRNAGVSLTEAEQIFFNWSEAITYETKSTVSEMNTLANSVVVNISFGSPSPVGFTFISEMMRQFKMTFPKARIPMYEAQLSASLPAVRGGCPDFVIGALSNETKLQDLHAEPLFESEFVLVMSRAQIGNGTVCLTSSQHEQRVLLETNMGYYSELLVTLQRSGICREDIVSTDSVVTIHNSILGTDFLTVTPCDMTMPFGSSQFVTIPTREVLPVARYAAVWLKNYRFKTTAASLVEMARQCPSRQGNRHWRLIKIA